MDFCNMEFSFKNVLFLFAFVLLGFTAVGQNSKIYGQLIDTEVNDTLSNITVTLFSETGSNKYSTSSPKGYFSFENLKPGYYKLKFKATNYKTYIKDSILVVSGKDVNLGKLSGELINKRFTKVTIKKVISTKTDAQIVKAVKEEEGVSNQVGQEQISQSSAGDAAKVAASIPGVTLMEGRFIMLRGLSQRYNSVQINNINAPSTEVDKRAFSFDLIPSNMLDKMAVYKSPGGELAGDFAGGDIKIETKSEIENDFYNYGFSLGFRLNTTMTSRYNNNVGSATDYFGFDNGNRALPSSFPSNLADYGTTKNIEFGKALMNNYQLDQMKVPLDFGAGFGFGKNISTEKIKIFTVNNFSYSTSYQYSDNYRYRYQNNGDTGLTQMFNYTDANLSIESKFNILSNWIFNPVSKSKIKKNTFIFRNIFNQIGENETTLRSGVNPTERPNDEFKNYSYHYTSRSIYFGQFEGIHRLSKNDKISYTLGFSKINRNEPDYRRFRTFREAGSNDPYTLIDPPSSSLFDAARFYSKLNENTLSATINSENKFRNSVDTTKKTALKTGLYAENKNRTFDARWISYSYAGDPLKKNAFLQTPVDQIFAPENLNTTSGFKPLEGTNPSDHYEASNQLASAYAQYTFPYKRFRFNVGLRSEYFNQTLKSATNSEKINVVLQNLNILPSLNSSLLLDSMEKHQLRFTYGRTVNRPEFRELAPFVYYDFMYDVNIVGNPDLKSAVINNYDFRYEFYPSTGEMMSIGLFYKSFLNPIENYVQPVGLSQQYQLKNAASATNYGVEVEIRRSLANSTQNQFLKKLSALINASYIVSEVDLGDASTLSQASKRPLQGQSPFIINASLQYKNDSTNTTLTFGYNIIGKRIVYVGNNIFPTVYEMPRHALDMTLIQKITPRMSLKFSVTDILNYQNQLWQDTNGDGKIKYNDPVGNDQKILTYKRGQAFSIGLSFKIVDDKK